MPGSRRFRIGFAVGRIAISLALAAAAIPAVDARLAPPLTAWAAVEYVVNLTTDGTDGACDSDCTLREAIEEANANAGADTITFSADVTAPIVLTSALPTISEELTIDGSGQSVAVDGDNTYIVFDASAPVTLTALTVQNGKSPTDGGGAYFGSTAVISAVIFISNTAADGG